MTLLSEGPTRDLVPIDDNIVIEPIDEAKLTPGGVALPDMAVGQPKRGKVVAVGHGLLLTNGDRVTPLVSVGDQVVFNQHVASEIEVNDQKLLVISERQILVIESF